MSVPVQADNGYRGGISLEQGVGASPYTVYCPRCGGAMLIAPEHRYLAVACPHCTTKLEPWRISAAASHEAVTLPHPSRAAGTSRQPATPPSHPMYAPQPMYASRPETMYSRRNRWVAGALGILLGAMGVHRFYLGFTGIGIVQLMLGVFTLGTVSGVWGFIEGILCFCGAMTDVDGRPLSG